MTLCYVSPLRAATVLQKFVHERGFIQGVPRAGADVEKVKREVEEVVSLAPYLFC